GRRPRDLRSYILSRRVAVSSDSIERQEKTLAQRSRRRGDRKVSNRRIGVRDRDRCRTRLPAEGGADHHGSRSHAFHESGGDSCVSVRGRPGSLTGDIFYGAITVSCSSRQLRGRAKADRSGDGGHGDRGNCGRDRLAGRTAAATRVKSKREDNERAKAANPKIHRTSSEICN